ncbi:helix-turn-helix domain-containing protein [Streptococcus iniae]
MKEVKNSIAMKSRQELIQALLRLMKNNNYQLITVSEISDEAQLSRRTFYRIYDSKNDILEDIFYQLSEDYKATFYKKKNTTHLT